MVQLHRPISVRHHVNTVKGTNHMTISMCAEKSVCYKGTNPLHEGCTPDLSTSQGPTLNTITLGTRASTYGFGGGAGHTDVQHLPRSFHGFCVLLRCLAYHVPLALRLEEVSVLNMQPDFSQGGDWRRVLGRFSWQTSKMRPVFPQPPHRGQPCAAPSFPGPELPPCSDASLPSESHHTAHSGLLSAHEFRATNSDKGILFIYF